MAKDRKTSSSMAARSRTPRAATQRARLRRIGPEPTRRTRAHSHRASDATRPLTAEERHHLRAVLGGPTAWGGKRPWPEPAVQALLDSPQDARAVLRAEEPMERWFVLNDLAARVTHEILRRQHRTLAFRTSSGTILCAPCAERGGMPLRPVFVRAATCAACDRHVEA